MLYLYILEVTVSSVGNTYLQDTLGQVVVHFTMTSEFGIKCDMDRWPRGRVSASVVVGSISSRGDHGMHC